MIHLVELLHQYGSIALLLGAAIYILLKSEIVIRYNSRHKDPPDNNENL